MINVIGIDLGTTNSVVAFLENGKPMVIQNAEGSKTSPSTVLYQENGDVIVGELAKRQRQIHHNRTIYSVKRFVGIRWDESKERRNGIQYPLTEGPDGLVAVDLNGEVLLPEEVQAEVLRKMKRTAEEYLGQTIEQAVITCPAYFNDSQRQATKKAAEMAGLEALRIINEPTAAALAYGMDNKKDGKIAVFDFGGGTFDISILEIDEDVFEVKSTCGDTMLGGDDIDRIVTRWIVDRILETLDLDVAGDPQAMSRIVEAAEKAKCELSTLEQASITLPFIGANEEGPKHFSGELTRSQFEQLIASVLVRLEKPCRQALADAGVESDQLEAVILVGGSTRIPAVQRVVGELFGQDPDRSVNPEEAVARGAAIQAGIMNGDLDEILLLDVTPLSLGIELAGGLFSPLITRNSNIPTTAKKRFTTVRDNQMSVRIHILQGERRMASENRTLARFRLEGIAPAPREVPEIEVTFTIDANGILQVSAKDLTTGSRQEVVVESYQPVKDQRTEQVIQEANERADADRQFMRKLAIRKNLNEISQDLEAQQRSSLDVSPQHDENERRVKEAIFRLDAALTTDDWERIDAADRELKTICTELMALSSMAAGSVADELIFDATDADEKTNHGEERQSSKPTANGNEITNAQQVPVIDVDQPDIES